MKSVGQMKMIKVPHDIMVYTVKTTAPQDRDLNVFFKLFAFIHWVAYDHGSLVKVSGL